MGSPEKNKFGINSSLELGQDGNKMCFQSDFPVQTSMASIELVMAIFTVCGNGLVVWVIVGSPRFHNTCSALFCSLAVADFLLGSLVLPLHSAIQFLALGRECFPRLLLGFLFSLTYVLNGASLLTLCLLSIDRCIVVMYPLRYKTFMTRTKLATSLSLIWVFTLTSGTVKAARIIPRSPLTKLLLVSVLIPYAVIILSYALVYHQIKRQNRVRAVLTNTNQERFQKSEDRLAKTIAMVIGGFTASWTPFAFAIMILPEGVEDIDHPLLQSAALFTFISPAINPLLYFFRSKEFRDEAIKVLGKRIPKKLRRRRELAQPGVNGRQERPIKELQVITMPL